ncbi:MAG: hypothetical protein KatS3mg050_2998 [Litorilinea sp.]|nr:MAG: hypothetical protein KatS3mg050_2998 [Litorilinea sp.]
MDVVLSLHDFLQAPASEVAKVAPQTIILTTGGTRRAAALAGISPTTDEYATFTMAQMLSCLQLLFDHGIRYIFAGIMTEANYHEITPNYRENLVRWTEEGLASSQALQQYRQLNWQVRLLGAHAWPELAPVARRLEQEIPARRNGPAVWFTVATDPDDYWHLVAGKIIEHGKFSRSQVIRAILGQDVPPATLYLGSGKPQLLISLVPPVLIGKLECYWRQHLGFALDKATLRHILYDYAYVRNTSMRDKTGRAERALHYRQAWENPPVVGLGTRLGPFWYPAPISPVPDPLNEGHPHG